MNLWNLWTKLIELFAGKIWEMFVYKHIETIEMFVYKHIETIEMFVYKHIETIEYVKK